MGSPLDFAEFYHQAKDDCLRAVLVSVGNQDRAQDLVDEAFARACASWRTVGSHPAPAAWVVRTALNMNISRWRQRQVVALRLFLDLDTGRTAEVARGRPQHGEGTSGPCPCVVARRTYPHPASGELSHD